MEKGIEIEVMGHKAKIVSVRARQADGRWYKEDFLMVGLDFDDGVEGLLGFAVRLPVKVYGRGEFVTLVKEEAEKTLSELLLKGRQERDERRREQEKQEALDSIAEAIKAVIGLT